jgi:hypothetical protein
MGGVTFASTTCFVSTAGFDSYRVGLSILGGPVCDPVDFNNDGLFPDTADIDALLRVFSGGVC